MIWYVNWLLWSLLAIVILVAAWLVYRQWGSPVFNLSKPTGPYAVGVKDYHLTDTARSDIYSKSLAHPYRELMVKVWFPAAGQFHKEPTEPYAPYLMDYYANIAWGWFLSFFYARIYSYAQSDLALSADKAQYPVIIFSHGSGCGRDSNTAQCEELASHGYIVIGISHTYGAGVVKFPDGRTVTFNDLLEKLKKEGLRPDRDQLSEMLVADVRFVLDKLEELLNDQESIFYQRFDRANIGIFGHSAGAEVAIKICQKDARLKACAAFDGILFSCVQFGDFDKPLMAMFAQNLIAFNQRPWTERERAMMWLRTPEDELKAKDAYLPAFKRLAQARGRDVYTLVVKDAGHLNFCDIALLQKVRPFSLFLPKMGSVWGVGAADAGKTITAINAYLVAFFDKYLKGRPSELLDGDTKQYPEVEARC